MHRQWNKHCRGGHTCNRSCAAAKCFVLSAKSAYRVKKIQAVRLLAIRKGCYSNFIDFIDFNMVLDLAAGLFFAAAVAEY